MREQMQCLGRMLVRSSNDVPLCENVEWMWAQCRSCCCTWITKNLRTPRVRGSSLKKTAIMQQQQQLIQQQLPQTPPSRNQWRQPKERLDSEDSSGSKSNLINAVIKSDCLIMKSRWWIERRVFHSPLVRARVWRWRWVWTRRRRQNGFHQWVSQLQNILDEDGFNWILF